MFCSISPSVAALSLLTLGSLSVAATPVVQQAAAPASASSSVHASSPAGFGEAVAKTRAAAPVAAATTRPVLALGVPAPQAPLALPAGEPSLEDLIHRFEESVGAVVLKTDNVCSQAASERVTLIEDLNVPPAEVYPFFENVLLQKGFHLSFLKGGAVPTFAIYSINHTPNYTMRWMQVDVGDLSALEQHPGLLVSCPIDLEKADARQVANNLRSLTTSNTQTVMASGERTILVRGTGDFVRTLGLVALQSDAATPAPKPEIKQPAAGQGR